MVELWFAQGFAQSFELLGCFIESCIIDCLAAWPRKGEIPKVYPLQMP
jgi:hypothetical protein